MSSRDLMMWIAFINQFLEGDEEKVLVATSVKDPFLAYYHGTCMVFCSHAQIATGRNGSGLTFGESLEKFLNDQSSRESDDTDMDSE